MAKVNLIALLDHLYVGAAPSDCPLPCTTFATETRRISDMDEYLGFAVIFENNVEVISSTLFAPTGALYAKVCHITSTCQPLSPLLSPL